MGVFIPSGCQNGGTLASKSLPLGPCLKNGVNLENITIPILKIRFWRVQEHAFSINFGYFFDLCESWLRDTLRKPIFPISGPCWKPSWLQLAAMLGSKMGLLGTFWPLQLGPCTSTFKGSNFKGPRRPTPHPNTNSSGPF